MNQSSIVFSICWHGPYPWYFPYFLHSCRHNPDIDFLIFTSNTGENIKIDISKINEIDI